MTVKNDVRQDLPNCYECDPVRVFCGLPSVTVRLLLANYIEHTKDRNTNSGYYKMLPILRIESFRKINGRISN